MPTSKAKWPAWVNQVSTWSTMKRHSPTSFYYRPGRLAGSDARRRGEMFWRSRPFWLLYRAVFNTVHRAGVGSLFLEDAPALACGAAAVASLGRHVHCWAVRAGDRGWRISLPRRVPGDASLSASILGGALPARLAGRGRKDVEDGCRGGLSTHRQCLICLQREASTFWGGT